MKQVWCHDSGGYDVPAAHQVVVTAAQVDLPLEVTGYMAIIRRTQRVKHRSSLYWLRSTQCVGDSSRFSDQ